VLHSSRNNSELPPPVLLAPLRKLAEQYPDRLQLHLFVDEPDAASSRPTLGDLQPSVQRIDKKAVEHALGRVQPSWWASMIGNAKPDAPSSTLFMVCGPHP
jgi:cytochrome-b5 reductase